MDLLNVIALHGPNLWARVSVLELEVDCSVWNGLPREAMEGRRGRLFQRLSFVSGRREIVRADDASLHSSCHAAAAMLGDLVLELQSAVFLPVEFGRTTATQKPGVYRVVVQFEDESLARQCLDAARRHIEAALDGSDLDLQADVARLRDFAQDACIGRATAPIVAAARARGIPFRRLDSVSLLQLGHGAKQHRTERAVTDRTGRIADRISTDKELTKSLLREFGIPVPEGRTASTADEAWAAACEIGLPVAIKPRRSDCGNGIGLCLSTREQVVAAVDAALKHDEEVIVETFALGEQHRLTVVGDKVVAACRRDPPRLIGDGRSSVLELISQANLDPRRGESDDLWSPICPDEDTPQMLAEQGFHLESIIPAGVEVVLSRIGHFWAGAVGTDVTEAMHPQTAAQCVSAARLIGLDIAGVDIIAQDIGRPLDEQGGIVVEVNVEPSIVVNLPPYNSVERPVGKAIVDSLFAEGETGRIPLAIVTGRGDNPRTARCLASLLRETGRIGMASADGLHLGDRLMRSGTMNTFAGTNALLTSPEVEAAVLERSLESLRHEGLGLDACDVAIVTRVGDDDASVLAPIARVLIDTVGPDGAVILDADDPALAALVDSASVSVILTAAHRIPPSPGEAGGADRRAVYRAGRDVVLRHNDGTEHVLGTYPEALPLEERSQDNLGILAEKSVVAAVAAAWALRAPLESIRLQLEQFLKEPVAARSVNSPQ